MELKMDPERRRQVLRPVMLRFVLLTFGVPLLSLVLMFALPREVYYGKPLAYLLGLGIFSFLPFFCIAGGYALYCSGRSRTQRVFVYPDQLVYTFYSGSLGNRTDETFVIGSIASYRLDRRFIYLRGDFVQKSTGRHNFDTRSRKLRIMRTVEREGYLLALLDRLVSEEVPSGDHRGAWEACQAEETRRR